MKKISGILLVLALVLSLGLVIKAPVEAAVSQPDVTVNPVLAASVAEYTVVFDITSSLTAGVHSIAVDFPVDTTVAANYTTGAITVNGNNVSSGDITVAGQKVTMKTPINVVAPGPVTVVFTTAANITNPTTTGDYTLWVNTSRPADDTPAESAEYAIREVPTITDVSPGQGNVGGIMWVVITGTSFMGDGDTNASDTVISFGAGADVLQTKYISVTEMNVEIEVKAAGTFAVTAETPAGASTTNGSFTANAAGTKQVDVWQKYTPSDSILDTNTLVFHGMFTNITAALAAASADYTLVAHSALYEEDFIINIEGLTLMSVSGADVTTIKGVATEPWSAYPLATPNIEILANEVKIHGFTIESPDVANDHYSSGIVLTGTDIEIYDNEFVSIGAGDGGCLVIQTYRSNAMPGSDISGLYIHGNTFTGTPDIYVGVFINHTTVGTGTVTIEDNILSGNIYQGVVTERDNTVISGNDIITDLSAEGYGIIVQDWDARAQDNVHVTGNTIKGSTPSCGFAFGMLIGRTSPSMQTLTNIRVTENTVQDNETGILVRTSADGVVVHYNNIAGNIVLGLENTDAATLDALYNWWGHAIGPHHDTRNPGGQLNAVTGNVDFSPWLYKPQEEFAHDAPCLAGSVVLDNEATSVTLNEATSYVGGWNSFSTPIALASSANAVSELLALAAESDLFILRAQRFDPATQQWVTLIMNNTMIAPDYQIGPGEGFFIQVRDKGSLPILVTTSTTAPPMRDLVAGWNLIGTSSVEKMSVATALSGVSHSVVISPKPPNAETWSVPPADAEVTYLELGEAYWVAMSASGKLFGYTYTPAAIDMTWELNQ